MAYKKNNKTLISRGELRVGDTLELRIPNKPPPGVLRIPIRVNEDGTFEYKYKGKTITVTSPSTISCHIYDRLTNGWDYIYDIDKDKTISVVCKSRKIIKRSRIQPRCGPKSKKKNANKKKSLREKKMPAEDDDDRKMPAVADDEGSDDPIVISHRLNLRQEVKMLNAKDTKEIFNPVGSVKDASTQADFPHTYVGEFLIKIINEQSEQLQKQREQIVALEKSDAVKMRRIGFLENSYLNLIQRHYGIRDVF